MRDGKIEPGDVLRDEQTGQWREVVAVWSGREITTPCPYWMSRAGAREERSALFTVTRQGAK